MKLASRILGATAPGGAGVFLVAWFGFGGLVAWGGASGAGFGWFGLRFGLWRLSICVTCGSYVPPDSSWRFSLSICFLFCPLDVVVVVVVIV